MNVDLEKLRESRNWLDSFNIGPISSIQLGTSSDNVQCCSDTPNGHIELVVFSQYVPYRKPKKVDHIKFQVSVFQTAM